MHSSQLEFICEAHNGLSARIVEEAGFAGIWGSGLSISAQCGVRDSNELSWTQVLDTVEFMSDATRCPILLDGDTGYGNFNNMRRLVKKLEQVGVAAVCIEDKLFPKTNSFIKSGAQPLADIDEFCGKIKAGKDAQRDEDFDIVARVEAFVAGWGLAEALRRAELYHAAGADAILIHSTLNVPDEVLAFKKEWGERSPVLIVPTKYYSTPTEQFRLHGFSMVIWANQILRSAVTAMQESAKRLFAEENLLSTEDKVVAVSEIFRLQGARELQEAEEKYLPENAKGVQAVVLGASRGEELGDLTLNKPKIMIKINGRPILSHIVNSFNAVGIKHITVVRGYLKETVNLPNIQYVDNDEYATRGELRSLQKALATLQGAEKDMIITYGDLLFNKFIPQILAEDNHDFVVAVDTNWQESVNRDRKADYVSCSMAHSRQSFNKPVFLQEISYHMAKEARHGEWMGFLKVANHAVPVLSEVLDTLLEKVDISVNTVPLLINALIARDHKVKVLYTTGHWLDIDSTSDIEIAGSFK